MQRTFQYYEEPVHIYYSLIIVYRLFIHYCLYCKIKVLKNIMELHKFSSLKVEKLFVQCLRNVMTELSHRSCFGCPLWCFACYSLTASLKPSDYVNLHKRYCFLRCALNKNWFE